MLTVKLGNRTKIKIVKLLLHLKIAEVDIIIMFGEGISKIGEKHFCCGFRYY